MFVLDYCYTNNRFNDYISISKDMRYFFYTRGIWEIGDECVHLRRAEAARIIGDEVEEFEALVYHINIAAKYGQTDGLDVYELRAKQIIEKGVIDREDAFRFEHALSLCDYSTGLYENAINRWNKILDSDCMTNNVHDIAAAKRWRLKAMEALGNLSSETIISLCIDCYKDAEESHFERAKIDYLLMVANEYIKINKNDAAREYLEKARPLLKPVNDLLYQARFNLYYALCLGESEESVLYAVKAAKLYDELGIEHVNKEFECRLRADPKLIDAVAEYRRSQLRAN